MKKGRCLVFREAGGGVPVLKGDGQPKPQSGEKLMLEGRIRRPKGASQDVLSKIKGIVEKALRDGSCETKLLPGLTRNQREFVEKLASGEEFGNVNDVWSALGLSRFNVSLFLFRFLKRLQRIEKGEPLLGGPHLHFSHRADKVRTLILGRMERGETLDEIAENARLSGFERQVIQLYVMPSIRPSQDEVAKKTGKYYPGTVSIALRRIEAKLRSLPPNATFGKNPRPKRFLTYRRKGFLSETSDAELADFVKASLAELRKRRSEP